MNKRFHCQGAMLLRMILCPMFFLAGFFLAGSIRTDAAQPADDAAASAPPQDQTPATQDPATQTPATQDSAAQDGDGKATLAYEKKLTEWKEIVKDLIDLKNRFQSADPDEVDRMRERWDEIIAKGNKMLPEFRLAATAAYREAPNVDRGLTRLLVQMITDELNLDHYESVAELTQAMIDSQCELGEVYNHAGDAAFVLNDFEKAEQYLTQAQNAGKITTRGTQYLGLIESYKEFWEQEQQLRQAEAEKDDLPRVKLTTSKGEIIVELFENEAEHTVGNFISLVEKGFYDGLTFHRVIAGFMAQGGCPLGTGEGGPGYDIFCETENENHRAHFRGTLSMAHRGKDTGGSQFFITFVPTDNLNNLHTAFGRVIQGMDVLAKLQRRSPEATPPLPEPDKIIKAEVLRKRDHEYLPDKVE